MLFEIENIQRKTIFFDSEKKKKKEQYRSPSKMTACFIKFLSLISQQRNELINGII